ncbi:hypothetical protein CXG81DRAFT_9832 [Caulochytrium protostelioides]|uniref:USP domain-containing protein n=1 Tax=Caulochytrium protostelioides TaxID=1555241 RepID=A0A4P9XCN8_9FUNG|nr:hypothetical protein CXG81DRAFT_9832 [Caulochytrium protostelioides]|eukprot:RKP03205.1 hypothetical protein CXG81DRAFT_9832 [Caulochytrium protostelioides]
MAGWQDTQAIALTNYQTGFADPATALCYDEAEELLWCGTTSGYVQSWLHAPGLPAQRYTSSRSHTGPVAQFSVQTNGVYSGGGNAVRLATRGGAPLWSARFDPPFRVSAFAFGRNLGEMWVSLSKGETQSGGIRIVKVGLSHTLRTIETDQEIHLLKPGSHSHIVGGSRYGNLVLMDARTCRIEKTVNAHACSLLSMDVADHMIATCGYSERGGRLSHDQMVKLYDVRMLRSLVPIAFPAGPTVVQFHPKKTGTLVIGSQSGQIQLTQVSNPAKAVLHQIPTEGFLTTCAWSSSGDLVAFADASGMVFECSTLGTDAAADAKPRINDASRLTELPPPPAPLPYIDLKDASVPLNAIGMPYYQEPLLSAWATLPKSCPAYTPPAYIPPEVTANVKRIDFVGYAPKPKTIRRNHLRGDGDASSRGLLHPTLSDAIIPTRYRPVHIQYSRFGIEDFDFAFYNKTRYAILETNIANSYCNPVLQCLFFIPPVRALARHHSATSCDRSICLLCELGFLFSSLESAQGPDEPKNCQATNFLNAFRATPQVMALGLADLEGHSAKKPSYAQMIANFNRFLLEALNIEFGQRSEGPLVAGCPPTFTYVQQLFASAIQTEGKCVCGSTERREALSYVTELTHSLLDEGKSFLDLLGEAFNRTFSTKAWCKVCQKYKQSTHRKTLRNYPNIMFINVPNVAGNTPDDAPRWWHGPHRIPPRLRLHLQNGAATHGLVQPGGGQITMRGEQQRDQFHLVAHICTDIGQAAPWTFFNDFLAEPSSVDDATSFTRWKRPATIVYVRDDLDAHVDTSLLPDVADPRILHKVHLVNQRRHITMKAKPLTAAELRRLKGMHVALDAEFVALNREETEVRSDGSRRILRPTHMALARVSVLRCADGGPNLPRGMPFIDEYIATSDVIVDYKTEFSGIKPGDLDVAQSKHPLVTHKSNYKKLRLLVNAGCIFVGHGLANDFRTINIHVPRAQIVDTVTIYFQESQTRRLSLRFLAWAVLGKHIQSENHDSIEDAMTAMLLYQHHQQELEAGTWEDLLHAVYDHGRAVKFKPPPPPTAST